MNFEINISLNGRHFFATHQRSINSSQDFETVLKTLQEKFPESEGYSITASFNPQVNYRFDLGENISAQVDKFLTK